LKEIIFFALKIAAVWLCMHLTINQGIILEYYLINHEYGSHVSMDLLALVWCNILCMKRTLKT